MTSTPNRINDSVVEKKISYRDMWRRGSEKPPRFLVYNDIRPQWLRSNAMSFSAPPWIETTGGVRETLAREISMFRERFLNSSRVT